MSQSTSATVDVQPFTLAYSPIEGPTVPFRLRPILAFMAALTWDLKTVGRIEDFVGERWCFRGQPDLQDELASVMGQEEAETFVDRMDDQIREFKAIAKRDSLVRSVASPVEIVPIRKPSKPQPRKPDSIILVAIADYRKHRANWDAKLTGWVSDEDSVRNVFGSLTTGERSALTRFLNQIDPDGSQVSNKLRRLAMFVRECVYGCYVSFPQTSDDATDPDIILDPDATVLDIPVSDDEGQHVDVELADLAEAGFRFRKANLFGSFSCDVMPEAVDRAARNLAVAVADRLPKSHLEPHPYPWYSVHNLAKMVQEQVKGTSYYLAIVAVGDHFPTLFAPDDPKPVRRREPMQHFLISEPKPGDDRPRNAFGILIGFGEAKRAYYENLETPAPGFSEPVPDKAPSVPQGRSSADYLPSSRITLPGLQPSYRALLVASMARDLADFWIPIIVRTASDPILCPEGDDRRVWRTARESWDQMSDQDHALFIEWCQSIDYRPGGYPIGDDHEDAFLWFVRECLNGSLIDPLDPITSPDGDDNGTTDRLPNGKTCQDCEHWGPTCSWLLGARRDGTEVRCDWNPSRFWPITIIPVSSSPDSPAVSSSSSTPSQD
jgi:hypothetical protein